MTDVSVHRARKRFGQNFLHDPNVIARIVRAAAPRPDQALLEIGPGQGALTAPLLEAAAQLTVIEIDRDLAAGLRTRFAGHPGFHLIEQDVLKVDFAALGTGQPGNLRIIGNLPYNISTPLLFHLLEQRELIGDMLFMLQLEVVDRMAALPGSSDYGRLSVMMQYHCKVEKLFTVPPGAFTPQPKVESAIVKLTPWRPLPHPARNPATLGRVVRTAFSQRRKTLRNALGTLLPPDQLDLLGLDLKLRPENVGLRDYVRIADLVDLQSQTPP
jgi:16S rRNA (adenine1518-N6/adenine1519-N6)-dimethyltransferase